MNVFLKIVSVALISLIVYMVLSKQNKDYSLLLTIVACCTILVFCISYLEPVLNFFHKLEGIGGLDSKITGILFQAAGIGILSEISAMVCMDAGNSSLSKVIQFAATMIILYISLPLFEGVIDLVSGILGEI